MWHAAAAPEIEHSRAGQYGARREALLGCADEVVGSRIENLLAFTSALTTIGFLSVQLLNAHFSIAPPAVDILLRMDGPWLQGVGARLRQARDLAGLTQEEAAERSQIKLTRIRAWERSRNAPAFDAITSLARVYGVSLDWLAGMRAHPQGLPVGEHLLDVDALERIKRAQSEQELVPMQVEPGSIPIALWIPPRARIISLGELKPLEREAEEVIRNLRKRKR